MLGARAPAPAVVYTGIMGQLENLILGATPFQPTLKQRGAEVFLDANDVPGGQLS